MCVSPKDFHRLASRGASGSGLGRGESLAALVARFDKVLLLSKALVLQLIWVGGFITSSPQQKRGGNEMVPNFDDYFFFFKWVGGQVQPPNYVVLLSTFLLFQMCSLGKITDFDECLSDFDEYCSYCTMLACKQIGINHH